MEILYPRIGRGEWSLLLSLALQGTLVACLYGVAHDQITYSISPEYFTRFKFAQFHYADFGWPVRWHVAEIGFLATWWVGFISGWLLTRSALRRFPPAEVSQHVRQAFGMIVACSAILGMTGYLAGRITLHSAELHAWESWRELGVLDLQSFVLVGYIHDSGYLGGLIGLVLGLLFLRRKGAIDSTPCA